MKRDWDIIRAILIKLEGLQTASCCLSANEVEGYHHEVVSYQIHLLIQAGLVEGECSKTIGSQLNCTAYRLTWAGHELLANIRDAGFFGRIKATARDKGVELSFDAVKQIAAHLLALVF